MGQPFPELRERLLSAGVAPRHVRRYIAELRDHLADLTLEEERGGLNRAEAESVGLVRLGDVDNLAKALIKRRDFQSWSARAPWAVFGFAPLCCLAAAYFAALTILWSGWMMFLPNADTPFGVGTQGFANLYFQAGRALYITSPVLIGWGMAAIAIRQRIRLVWPAPGLFFLALMGAMARVQAGRTAVPAGIGHIRFTFLLGHSIQAVRDSLTNTLVTFSLTALPYLIWRARFFISGKSASAGQ